MHDHALLLSKNAPKVLFPIPDQEADCLLHYEDVK